MNVNQLPPNMQAKIRVNPSTGCWEWTGAKNSRGYGQVGVLGVSRSTHRVAYELLVGPIPDDLQIDHQPPRPPCPGSPHPPMRTPRRGRDHHQCKTPTRCQPGGCSPQRKEGPIVSEKKTTDPHPYGSCGASKAGT